MQALFYGSKPYISPPSHSCRSLHFIKAATGGNWTACSQEQGRGNVCCHPPELIGRTKPSYDQYSFNNISQHLPGTYLKAKAPPDKTISYTNHPPFAFGSWELLLQSFLIFSFQDAEAQELGGPVGREEAQLCSAAHKAVRVVPVIYHSQLRLFRMHHFLGNPDLALR